MSDQPAPENPTPAPTTPPAAATPPVIPTHSKVEQALLYNAYLKHRIDVQKRFYRDRIQENMLNSDFSFISATVIMAITSFLSAASAVLGTPIVTFIGALLPALAATLGAFRQLYGWDRQSRIYQDAMRGLARAGLRIPDNDELPNKNLATIYPPLVTAIEDVFKAEISQWGQFVLDKDKQTDEEAAADPFNRLINNMGLSEEQISAIRKIVDSGKTPQ
ncbi:MAG: SLATT domain-containing protein [Anaerolineae bacterium]